MSDHSFKGWLKQQRRSLDLTQAELAHKVGCSIVTIQKVEEGAARPSRQLAELLAAALEIPPEEQAAFVQQARALGPKSGVQSAPGTVTAKGASNGPAPALGAASVSALAEPANPYKGLRAFYEQDAPDFFGRELITEQLVERLGEGTELSRFLAVVGPSGAGKSSVVQAGLLPLLRQHGLPSLGSDRDSHDARHTVCYPVVATFSPGTHPLEELEAALLRVATNPPPSLMEQLCEDERGLARAVKRILPGDDRSELLLFIDQFEELFTMVSDERVRARFIDSLFCGVADERSRLRVVIALRADFYDRPLLYLTSSELFRRRTEVLGPLSADEMYRAITGPAERYGLELETGLAAAIMRDVAEQPGMLPLMEYALTELFERREGPDGQIMTLAAYRQSGGVFGSLARRAESVHEGLSSAERAEARQLFLRLVTPGETVGQGADDTRRRVLLSELHSAARGAREGAALNKVLDLYGRYRMLTFDRDPLSGGPTVEVAHEALLRSWERLGGWLSESRERLLVHRRLLSSAAEWRRSGQEPSFLSSGARLAQFAGLVGETGETGETGDAGGLALTAEEHAYLAASLREERRQEQAEREQQSRELALQKRAASRLRYLLLGAAVFLVVALILATWALNRSQVAQDNFAHADALRLAAEANNLLSSHGPSEQAALLSIRSIQEEYSPQADSDLLLAADLAYPVRRFSGHSDDVWALDFSPDGKYLVTASLDHTARVWDVASGQTILTLSGDTASVNNALFSPDGKRIATSSDDGTARVWDAATGKPLLIVKQPPVVLYAAFSPDGKYLLTGGLDGAVRTWDALTGQSIRVFSVPADQRINRFSRDGKYVASDAGEDQVLWATDTGRQVQVFHHAGSPVFSPDGKRLLIGSGDGLIRLWDINSGQLLQLFAGHTAGITNVAFSSDGKFVLSASADHTARLWDVTSGQTLRIFADHSEAVFGVAFSPDGRQVATGSTDNSALLWNTQSTPVPPRFVGHKDIVFSATFSPDGKRILTSSNDRTVRVWDAATGKELLNFVAHEVAVEDSAFSPDGKALVTAGQDRLVKIWDAGTGKQLQTLTGHGDVVERALFLPDGKRVVSVSDDDTARVWEVATGVELRRFTGHKGSVRALAIASGGKAVATGGDDMTVRVWNPDTGKELQVLRGHAGRVNDVAFSPDGKTLLTASSDGTARLWDVAGSASHSGKESRRLVGHNAAVYAVAFSQDGKYALTGSADQTVRTWDIQTGQELRRFTGDSQEVRSVAFSADGKYALTAGGDGIARLWYTGYHDTIHYLCGLLTRDLTPDERARYGITDQAPACPAH